MNYFQLLNNDNKIKSKYSCTMNIIKQNIYIIGGYIINLLYI